MAKTKTCSKTFFQFKWYLPDKWQLQIYDFLEKCDKYKSKIQQFSKKVLYICGIGGKDKWDRSKNMLKIEKCK